jgi:DNA-binding winged helix-turn-helix (wHTH) protein/phosphohistidine phosphatase SixA
MVIIRSVSNKYTLEHLTFDFHDYKIESNGVELSIDLKAVKVLEMMINNAGQTVSIDSFMDKVWANKPSSPEVVTAAIARLRKLFKMAGICENLIVTVHKVGYRFEQPNPHATEESPPPKYRWATALLLIALLASIVINLKHYINQPDKLDLSQTELASIRHESESNVTQIYILRHAEKSDSSSKNPNLSSKGIKHANYWKKVLQYVKFDRVLTTDYIRSIKTAKIISGELNIEPEIYHPMSFEILKFIQDIQGEKALIIGHSNTIPDMVNRLIDESKYPPMSHENYNLMYLITIDKNGDTSSSLMHIEQPTP